MSVTFRVERFEGPLDLLLQLVEREELEISEISLSAVADQFVSHLRLNQGTIPAEELADFMVIAAKLIYMKSRLLIPSLEEEVFDEGPDLATQLRLYPQFMQAATELNRRWDARLISFPRERVVTRSLEPRFSLPESVTCMVLSETMKRVIARLAPLVKLPQAAIKRIVRIQDKISELANRLRTTAKISFHEFMRHAKDKQERVVSFLALLELVKQRVVHAEQENIFEDIDIMANDLDRLTDLKLDFV